MNGKSKEQAIFFKTCRGVCGVWSVKYRFDGNWNGYQYWNTRRAAWNYLKEQATTELERAEKSAAKARRNLKKTINGVKSTYNPRSAATKRKKK